MAESASQQGTSARTWASTPRAERRGAIARCRISKISVSRRLPSWSVLWSGLLGAAVSSAFVPGGGRRWCGTKRVLVARQDQLGSFPSEARGADSRGRGPRPGPPLPGRCRLGAVCRFRDRPCPRQSGRLHSRERKLLAFLVLRGFFEPEGRGFESLPARHGPLLRIRFADAARRWRLAAARGRAGCAGIRAAPAGSSPC